MPIAALAGPTALRRFVRLTVVANVAVFLVLALTVAVALFSSRAAYTARAQSAAENLALVLSLNIGGEIKQIDNALVSTMLETARQSGNGRPEPALVSRIANEQRLLVPQVDTIRLTDREGFVINNDASHDAAAPISLADRDYFKAAQAAPGRLIISEPLQGRIIQKSGVILARARVDANGQFQGIAYSALSTAHFVDIFDDVKVGEHGAVTLRSEGLRLVARYSAMASAPSADVGSTKISSELKSALGAAPDHGSFISRTAIDGIERATAYQHVPGYPLLVLVGIGTEDSFKPWRREALEVTALSGLLLVLIASLSLLLYRQQHRQMVTLRQLAKLSSEQQALLDNELVSMARFRDRTIVWNNKALSTLFGYEVDEMKGMPARTLYVTEEAYEDVGRGYAYLAAGQRFRKQVQMRRKDGRVLWIDLSGVQLPEQESLWMMVDITAVKDSESQARHVAAHDGLTGLGNRSQLPQALDQALHRARQARRGLAVCYVDLDGFKAVNDNYGHAAGDELLQELARRMMRGVRSEDALIRMGGDEFVIVLNGLSGRKEIEIILNRLLASLQASVKLEQGIEVSVGASIGIAIYPDHGSDADSLMGRADQAMYEAKRAGKNRLLFSTA